MTEILIPVKNPPKNCHECKNGWCNLWEQNKNMTTGKHPDCPMKELPPHGDLVNRGNILLGLQAETLGINPKDKDFEGIKKGILLARKVVNEADSVVPASGGK